MSAPNPRDYSWLALCPVVAPAASMPPRISDFLLASLLLARPSAAQESSRAGFAPSTAKPQRACEAQLAEQPTPETFRSPLAALTDAIYGGQYEDLYTTLYDRAMPPLLLNLSS